jgi:hypothetical protein
MFTSTVSNQAEAPQKAQRCYNFLLQKKKEAELRYLIGFPSSALELYHLTMPDIQDTEQ